jgi:hypothetical protein
MALLNPASIQRPDPGIGSSRSHGDGFVDENDCEQISNDESDENALTTSQESMAEQESTTPLDFSQVHKASMQSAREDELSEESDSIGVAIADVLARTEDHLEEMRRIDTDVAVQ